MAEPMKKKIKKVALFKMDTWLLCKDNMPPNDKGPIRFKWGDGQFVSQPFDVPLNWLNGLKLYWMPTSASAY